MSAPLSEKAFAKINLTLRVLGRRADGYHELESLVAFADVADALTLEPGSTDGLEMSGPFAGKSGPVDDNLVLKSLAELRRRIPGLKGGRFRLEKNLPVAAGIGGGSADAAAALRLLARANGIALDDSRLMAAAQAVGADVPVCLDSRPRIMRGIGEVLSEPLDLPPIPAVLVNPGVALVTREVFGKFKGAHAGPGLAGVPTKTGALIELLKQQDNDLTVAATACAPVVGEVLAALRSAPGSALARMSGSGATCFALFGSREEAAAAAQRLAGERKNWWVQAAAIGAVSRRKHEFAGFGRKRLAIRQLSDSHRRNAGCTMRLYCAVVLSAALVIVAADPALARTKSKSRPQCADRPQDFSWNFLIPGQRCAAAQRVRTAGLQLRQIHRPGSGPQHPAAADA